MKTVLKVSTFILLLVIIIIGCKKGFSDQDATDKLNEEFSSKNVREWYYRTFIKSAEFSSFNQTKNGVRLPDWGHTSVAKIGNWNVVEFPLIRAKSNFAIPGKSSLSDFDYRKIASASVSRILFIKADNNMFVREIEYIPDLQYLLKKQFNIGDLNNVSNIGDFTGSIVIKKWDGSFLSLQTVVDGKTVSFVDLRKKNTSLAKAANSLDGGCGEECIWQEDCDMTIYGDGMVTNDCGPWYNTGDCWSVGNCGDGGGDPCTLYGIGCPGGGDDPPPPQQDPCAAAQLGSNNAKNLSQTSNYANSKSNIQSAAASDNKEHGVTFGKDANGNITTSNMTTGGTSNGSVPNLPGAFADMHNHTDNSPPSSGDLYGFIDLAQRNSLYETRYIVTTSGSVYALTVTNLQAAHVFDSLYQRVPNGNLEPGFPSDIVDEINKMKGWYNSTEEMAMAFILEKYNSGIALLKQDSNGNFKRLNTKETITANGDKSYNANNCQ